MTFQRKRGRPNKKVQLPDWKVALDFEDYVFNAP